MTLSNETLFDMNLTLTKCRTKDKRLQLFTRTKNGEIRWREGNSPGIEEYCLTLEKKRIRAKKCDFPGKRTSDSQQWNLLQKVGIFSELGSIDEILKWKRPINFGFGKILTKFIH